MTETTRIYLNTWGAYNDGCNGYGWMTPDEAIEFMEADPERDGGEWFIADIDNYLGVDFGSLEYCNVDSICEQINQLEAMDEWEVKNVVAYMEYSGSRCTVEDALENMDNHIFYSDVDEFYNLMDELLDFHGVGDVFERYFDFDAYHRDCMMDAYEASNGVVIC